MRAEYPNQLDYSGVCSDTELLGFPLFAVSRPSFFLPSFLPFFLPRVPSATPKSAPKARGAKALLGGVNNKVKRCLKIAEVNWRGFVARFFGLRVCVLGLGWSGRAAAGFVLVGVQISSRVSARPKATSAIFGAKEENWRRRPPLRLNSDAARRFQGGPPKEPKMPGSPAALQRFQAGECAAF